MESTRPQEASVHRVAVIDCGTNTFSLVVADLNKTGWRNAFTMRQVVFLGQGGFKQASLLPDRFAKGIDAMRVMKSAIQNLGVEEVQVFATSAVRDATNGLEFCGAVRKWTGWEVRVLSGLEEAQWIHEGVSLTCPPINDVQLTMDIGGGSLEFVLWRKVKLQDVPEVLWSTSVDAGIARLEDFGAPSDPLSVEGESRFLPFLDYTLAAVVAAMKLHQPGRLIGAAGSFDTLLEMVHAHEKINVPSSSVSPSLAPIPKIQPLDLKVLEKIHHELVRLPIEKRLTLAGMAPARARMMPLASMLIQYVLKNGPEGMQVFQSPFALREGALRRMQEAWTLRDGH